MAEDSAIFFVNRWKTISENWNSFVQVFTFNLWWTINFRCIKGKMKKELSIIKTFDKPSTLPYYVQYPVILLLSEIEHSARLYWLETKIRNLASSKLILHSLWIVAGILVFLPVVYILVQMLNLQRVWFQALFWCYNMLDICVKWLVWSKDVQFFFAWKSNRFISGGLHSGELWEKFYRSN